MIWEVAVKVLNLIQNPPANNPYRHLKDRLLRIFALNDYTRAEAIANLPLISHVQPSTLMSRSGNLRRFLLVSNHGKTQKPDFQPLYM